MRTQRSIIALVCTFLLLGCDQRSPQQPTATTQQTAAAPAALTCGSPPCCLHPGAKVNTCEPRKGGAAKKGDEALVCHVYVFNTPEGTVVYPYSLKVPENTKAKIVWHLLEPDTKFLPVDGPQELKNDPEFEEGGPVEEPEGVISPSGKKYKFKYKNSATGRTFPYKIQFRDDMGTAFSCDPTITNLSN